MHQLQKLRDELYVDQSASGIFEIPRFAVAFFLRYSAPHLDNIAGDGGRISRPTEYLADHRLDFSGKNRRRADDAPAGHRHVLPSPCLVFLIELKAVDLG